MRLVFQFKYAVSGWDGFNFLHRSLYDGVTGIFVRKIALIAHECCVCCTACRVSRLSLFAPCIGEYAEGKKMGRDAARTANPL